MKYLVLFVLVLVSCAKAPTKSEQEIEDEKEFIELMDLESCEYLQIKCFNTIKSKKCLDSYKRCRKYYLR